MRKGIKCHSVTKVRARVPTLSSVSLLVRQNSLGVSFVLFNPSYSQILSGGGGCQNLGCWD